MASSTPTWVFGSNFQVELKNGKATRLQSLESPYCLIGPSGKPLLDSSEIEGRILITYVWGQGVYSGIARVINLRGQ